MVKDAIAEAAQAYVEALSTDRPAHITSALYTRWWALEHPVALWPDAPRESAPRLKFEWKEIKSFEGYEARGPWGKAYVVYYPERGLWGSKVYLPGLRVVNDRLFVDCAKAIEVAEGIVNRWEKGGRDE
jgi:hypothetical protein